MYAVDGGRGSCPSARSTTCPATPGRRPVRIGNGAVEQQPDRRARRGDDRARAGPAGRPGQPTTTPGRCSARWSTELAEHLAGAGQRAVGDPRRRSALHPLPGDGLGRPSTARCGPSRTYGLDGPVDRWRELRDEVRDEVLDQGFDAERDTFTQHYDTTEVDASLLVLPLVGFIAGDDPRMLGTIEAVEEDLMRDGLLLRYRTETGVDGLCRATSTRSWPARSGWSRRTPRAGRARRRARALRPAGRAAPTTSACSSEEYDPRHGADGRQLPAGLQPPGAGAGGVPAAGRVRHRALSHAAYVPSFPGASWAVASGHKRQPATAFTRRLGPNAASPFGVTPADRPSRPAWVPESLGVGAQALRSHHWSQTPA